MAPEPTPPARPTAGYTPSALPPTGARVLAFVAILLAGVCGGIIGYAFVFVQVEDGSLWPGVGAVVGAVGAAVGVAVVATLALRAMTEWRTGTTINGQ